MKPYYIKAKAKKTFSTSGSDPIFASKSENFLFKVTRNANGLKLYTPKNIATGRYNRQPITEATYNDYFETIKQEKPLHEGFYKALVPYDNVLTKDAIYPVSYNTPSTFIIYDTNDNKFPIVVTRKNLTESFKPIHGRNGFTITAKCDLHASQHDCKLTANKTYSFVKNNGEDYDYDFVMKDDRGAEKHWNMSIVSAFFDITTVKPIEKQKPQKAEPKSMYTSDTLYLTAKKRERHGISVHAGGQYIATRSTSNVHFNIIDDAFNTVSFHESNIAGLFEVSNTAPDAPIDGTYIATASILNKITKGKTYLLQKVSDQHKMYFVNDCGFKSIFEYELVHKAFKHIADDFVEFVKTKEENKKPFSEFPRKYVRRDADIWTKEKRYIIYESPSSVIFVSNSDESRFLEGKPFQAVTGIEASDTLPQIYEPYNKTTLNMIDQHVIINVHDKDIPAIVSAIGNNLVEFTTMTMPDVHRYRMTLKEAYVKVIYTATRTPFGQLIKNS